MATEQTPSAGGKAQPLWLQMKLRGFKSQDVLQYFGVSRPPVDVFGIAALMGINVHVQRDLPYDGAVRSSWERADIWVRDEPPKRRQRFTVAHEIGHLLLHALGTDYRDKSLLSQGSPKTPLERQADAFAAALLMPRFMLQPLIYGSGARAAELAQIFDVSPQAMEIRIDWIRKGRADI